MHSLFPQITVDMTAPLPGVVSDSEQSEPDVDFQQGSTQHASWQGFFDRESGIMFYQFAFSDHCLTASDFSVPPKGKVTFSCDILLSRCLDAQLARKNLFKKSVTSSIILTLTAVV